MAIFTVAESTDILGEMRSKNVYETPEDVKNLIYYGAYGSAAMVKANIYNLGLDCMYYQFMYLQKRRAKKINNRALHFILSFDTLGYEADIDVPKVQNIMAFLNSVLFQEYQHLFFLHTDCPTHLHIYMVVNPVNVNTLKIFDTGVIQLGKQIAEWLAEVYKIPLHGFTYRDEKGQMRWGKEYDAGLYQDKFFQKWGLKPMPF